MTLRLIMGYDGSPESGSAIEAGGLLFPGRTPWSPICGYRRSPVTRSADGYAPAPGISTTWSR